MEYREQHNILLINKHFLDLNPVEAGWHVWEKNNSDKKVGPTVRDYYVLHYIISGKGTYNNPRGSYNLRAGEYFLIKPGEVVSYKPDAEKPWHYVWIGFDGALAAHFGKLPDVGILKDAQPILDVMHAEDGNSRYEEFLAGKLFMLYYGFLCNTKDEPSYTRRVKNFIKSNYSAELSVENIASRLGVNRIYLSRIFKEDYGISIKQYIVSVRMNHAKKFLEDGHSVSDVADMVGYSDAFGFSKMFKSYFGIAPSNIRK